MKTHGGERHNDPETVGVSQREAKLTRGDRKTMMLKWMQRWPDHDFTVHDFEALFESKRIGDWSSVLTSLCYDDQLIHNPPGVSRREKGAGTCQVYRLGDGPRRVTSKPVMWECRVCGWLYSDRDEWPEHKRSHESQ